MEGLFRISAVVLIGVAAFFLWNRNIDVAFVTAAIGCVSFFLSVRSEVKERVDERNAEIISRQDEVLETTQPEISDLRGLQDDGKSLETEADTAKEE